MKVLFFKETDKVNFEDIKDTLYSINSITESELNSMYRVELDRVYMFNMAEWFRDNIHHGFVFDSWQARDKSVYWFDDENEAIMFKLRFG